MTRRNSISQILYLLEFTARVVKCRDAKGAFARRGEWLRHAGRIFSAELSTLIGSSPILPNHSRFTESTDQIASHRKRRESSGLTHPFAIRY